MENIRINGLKTEELKQIIEEITEEEQKEVFPEKLKVHPIFLHEYYKIDKVKTRWKLVDFKEKISIIRNSLRTLGLNFKNDNEIYIILTILFKETIKKRIDTKNPHQLVELITTVYHEIGHSRQRIKTENYSYYEQMLINPIEDYIKNNNGAHYGKNHDDYLSEIDADIYGITKSEQFLKQNNLYEEEKDYIKGLKAEYYLRKKNYDFDEIFEEFYKIYKSKAIKQRGKINNNLPLETFIDIFFEKDTANFKSIIDICRNKNFDTLDKEMFCRVLTSRPFIEQLNFKEITREEISFMIEIIKYIFEQEENKRRYNESLEKKNLVNEYLLQRATSRNIEKMNQLKYILSELQLRDSELIIERQKLRKNHN